MSQSDVILHEMIQYFFLLQTENQFYIFFIIFVVQEYIRRSNSQIDMLQLYILQLYIIN
ncbi:hypothetical protein pb186bvf_008883 [Paramecium bursaria]